MSKSICRLIPCACLALAGPLHGQSLPLGGIPGVETSVGVELFGVPLAQTLRSQGSEALRLGFMLSHQGGYGIELEARPADGSGRLSPSLWARVSTLERRRFYGWGNQSQSPLPSAAYEFRPLEAAVQAGLRFERKGLELRLGPELRHLYTDLDLDDALEPVDADRPYIADLRPYGSGSFSQVALAGRLDARTAGPGTGARAGVGLRLDGRWSPAALDVRSPYAAVTAEASAFVQVGLPGSPLFAARLGLERASPEAPYFDAAYMGGRNRLRGIRSQRYAGDGAVWVGVENRLQLGSATIRGKRVGFGTTLFADAGRLMLDGEDGSAWRAGYGGGLWVAPEGGPAVSLAAARAEGDTRFYFQVGLFGWK